VNPQCLEPSNDSWFNDHKLSVGVFCAQDQSNFLMPTARDWSYLSQRDENATGSSDLCHVRHVCDDNIDDSFSKVDFSPIFQDKAICLPSSSSTQSIPLIHLPHQRICREGKPITFCESERPSALRHRIRPCRCWYHFHHELSLASPSSIERK
jgi:hypothetical protein